MTTSVAALLCAALSIGCAERAPSWEVTDYGLIEAPLDRPVVLDAIDLVLQILPSPRPSRSKRGGDRTNRPVPCRCMPSLRTGSARPS
jgi:hypothetical protein